VTSNATATGGNGGSGAGTASATAIGQGASGTDAATAATGLAGSLVTAVQAQAQAPVAGTSTALAWAAIGQGGISAPALVADQAEAQITAEPTTADVNTINNANSHVKTAFTTGKTPTYFGIGELGGAYSTNDTGSETQTCSIRMTVDLTKFSPLHDLIIGFYSGTSSGAGFTGMTLDVNVNGTDHINNFATLTAANAFFQNSAFDYGALSGTSLQLDISLSITESAAGGYDFGMLIGDPPPARPAVPSPANGEAPDGSAAAVLAALGQAAASFKSTSGADVGGPSSAQQDNSTPMLATPLAIT
jgi:hypothetical protein